MPTRLYIIGNGFDIAHDFPCRYLDFKEYCRVNDPGIYQRINLFYTDSDKLWSDFEKEMPNINENNLFNWATAQNNEWNQNWDGYYWFIDTVREEVDYLQYLPFTFRDWVRSININNAGQRFRLNIGNSLYLSFNYTRVLEQVYGIPAHLVNHIHGVVDGDLALIAVGHGSTDEEINEMFDSENRLESEACNEIKDLVRSWRKDTASIIQRNRPFFNALYNVNEIFVLGHSMANVDMPYFQEVKENVQPNALWSLSAYDERDYRRKHEAVQDLQLADNNVHIIQLENLAD